jgi:hypothetical protein
MLLAKEQWNSGTSADIEDTNVIWGTARDVDQAVTHGKIAWKGYRLDEVEWVVGVSDGSLPEPNQQSDWNNGSQKLGVTVRNKGGNQLRISERKDNGNLDTVLDNIAIADGQDIEIHFDQVSDDATQDIYAKYYVNGVEVVIPTTADRWRLRPGLDLVPCGTFQTPNITQSLIEPNGTFSIPDCIKTFSFTTGSGYLNGEIIQVQGNSGGITTGLISTNSSGEIISISLQEHGANFNVGADTGMTITGLMSGKAIATMDVLSVEDSIVINSGGTGYTTNAADLIIDGVTFSGAVTITTIGGGGVITDFTITDPLINQTQVVAGATATITQGVNSSAQITIEAVNAKSNLIYNVITDTINRGVDEPLGLHNRATFRPSDGFKQTTSMNAVGPAPATPLTSIGGSGINDGREDTMMLVNVEQFQIKSICKSGGIQKAVASVPYGLTQPFFESGDPVKVDGEFYYEPYNMLYHSLSNPNVENHNQLRVRLTDALGNPIKQLQHPTTLTLDLRPRAI